MFIILIILSIIVAVGGALSLSNATMGVGIIGLACMLACFARIAQASSQHAELKQLLADKTPQLEPQATE